MTDTEKQLLTHCPNCNRSLSLAIKYCADTATSTDLKMIVECICGWQKKITYETIKA